MRLALVLLASLALVSTSCGKKKEEVPATAPVVSAPAPSTTAAATAPASAAATASSPPAVAVPPGSPPPDGKYERVVVDGVTVPMVNVMNKGAVVLVDTDGAKPRT